MQEQIGKYLPQQILQNQLMIHGNNMKIGITEKTDKRMMI